MLTCTLIRVLHLSSCKVSCILFQVFVRVCTVCLNCIMFKGTVVLRNQNLVVDIFKCCPNCLSIHATQSSIMTHAMPVSNIKNRKSAVHLLCKILAGASCQPGGQTRKQMDLFGLKCSHAISSSWSSFLNLHVSADLKEGSRVGVCAVWGRELSQMLLVSSIESKKTELEQHYSMYPFLINTGCAGLCLHMVLTSMVVCSIPLLSHYRFSPMALSAVCSSYEEHFACLSHKYLAFFGINCHHTL